MKTPGSGYARGEGECEGDSPEEAIETLIGRGAPEELRELSAPGLQMVCGASFIRLAHRSFPAFRGDCSEKTWLMRIAVNTCRDMIHSAWFRHLDRRITPEQLPESCEQTDEEAVDLTIEVMRLSQKHREVMKTARAQIAQALGVAKSTVSVRLEQGRQNLRKMLERRRSHG